MAYSGTSLALNLGQLGLLTDDTAQALPVNSLMKANNVAFSGGRIGKFLGSTKFNDSALSDEVVGVYDYFPAATTQVLIAVTKDGLIYRDTGDGSFNSNTSIGAINPVTTTVKLVTCGAEQAGSNRKLAILSSSDQINIIDGNAAAVRDIRLPSADWQSSSFPTYGINYANRFWVMGSGADRHRLYSSTISDHENFVGTNFPTSRWELWSRIAATPNVDLTSDVQGGTEVDIITLTNNDGYIVYGLNQFDKFTMTISVAESGSAGVYVYYYWNGSSWTSFIPTTEPDYTATGSTSAIFDIPSDWATGDGTEGGGNNNYYAIRVLATTAPGTTGVSITSLTVINTSYETAPPTFSVFPGEGEGILCAAVYRGLLFIFKDPQGVYILDGRSPDSSNWTVSRYSDAFGVASPHGVLQVLNDLIASNAFGSFTSLQASDAFGDFEAGDILANNKVEDYIREQLNYAGITKTQSIYYPEKKLAIWTGASASNGVMNRMLVIDVASPNPRISIMTKDAPNCLGLRKDGEGILRPMYGTVDGDIYLMDSPSYNVNNVAYSAEFQTNYSDLGQVDSQLSGKNKIFEFLDVSYIPTGNNAFYCDIYIDGTLRDTLVFNTELGTELDEFLLDTDVLTGDATTKRNRLRMYSCTGNKISLRFYNNNLDEGFIVERAILGFRVSGDQVTTGQIL